MLRTLFLAIWYRLGICPVCMRSAFTAAAITWLVTLGVALTEFPGLPISLVAAGGATLVWLAHLVAYSVKRVYPSAAPGDNGTALPVTMSRREALGRFLRLLAGAAAFTIAPAYAGGNPNQAYNCSPTNNYQSDRVGTGPCEGMCNDQFGKKDCPKGTRPIIRTGGSCTCCSFPECPYP